MSTSLTTRTPLPRKALPKRGPRIDYSQFPWAKIVRKPKDILYRSGDRIIFNRRTESGKALYHVATVLMAERQNWFCSLCGLRMNFDEISFEHGDLRGMGGGRRNDDISAVNGDGIFINSAAHLGCNVKKGSRRTVSDELSA